MPFAKPNWTCEPPLPKSGFFEFGQVHTARSFTLSRGEQTRPCFVHVSSEVECAVRSLSIVASVDTVDVYALVGPAEAFDYRHVAKLQGEAIGQDGSGTMRYRFVLDPRAMPREATWQVQLKLSSGVLGPDVVAVDELTVCVERSLGHADPVSAQSGAASLGRSGRQGLTAPAESQQRASLSSSKGVQGGAAPSWGISRVDSRADSSDDVFMTSASQRSMGASGTLNTSQSYSRSAAVQPKAATTPLLADVGLDGQMAKRADLSVKSRRDGLSSSLTQGQADLAGAGSTRQVGGNMRQETAAVASVLNAVCEKMVGVVSEKTKSYLSKAGKRTERRVVDRIMRLEERIERFDQALESSAVAERMGSIEEGVLGLQHELQG